MFFNTHAHLYFIPMFSHNLHQPWEQVGHSMGREGLSQGTEDLEWAPGIMAGGAAEGCLQRNVAQLML